MLIEASLGLQFDPAGSEIRLIDPRLPSFLDWVMLRDLQLGDCMVDLVARRNKDNVAVEVMRTKGPVRVAVIHSSSAASGS